MSTIRALHKIGGWIVRVLEFYLPLVTFLMMFFTFLIGIFFRYFAAEPLVWTQEMVTFCFIWTALLGASYAFTTDSHVWFTLFYETRSKKGQRTVRIINNLFMFFIFAVLLVPSFKYVNFMSYREATSFAIKYDLIYAPFVIMIVLVLVRLSVFLYRDITDLVTDIKSPKQVDTSPEKKEELPK